MVGSALILLEVRARARPHKLWSLHHPKPAPVPAKQEFTIQLSIRYVKVRRMLDIKLTVHYPHTAHLLISNYCLNFLDATNFSVLYGKARLKPANAEAKIGQHINPMNAEIYLRVKLDSIDTWNGTL